MRAGVEAKASEITSIASASQGSGPLTLTDVKVGDEVYAKLTTMGVGCTNELPLYGTLYGAIYGERLGQP